MSEPGTVGAVGRMGTGPLGDKTALARPAA
jgi:hypothetical protein